MYYYMLYLFYMYHIEYRNTLSTLNSQGVIHKTFTQQWNFFLLDT